MKVSKEKSKKDQKEPTYCLSELSVSELKSICNGLKVIYDKTNNNNIKRMVADITAGALKDHIDRYSDPVDVESLKKQNRAMLQALHQIVPGNTNQWAVDNLPF